MKVARGVRIIVSCESGEWSDGESGECGGVIVKALKVVSDGESSEGSECEGW